MYKWLLCTYTRIYATYGVYYSIYTSLYAILFVKYVSKVANTSCFFVK